MFYTTSLYNDAQPRGRTSKTDEALSTYLFMSLYPKPSSHHPLPSSILPAAPQKSQLDSLPIFDSPTQGLSGFQVARERTKKRPRALTAPTGLADVVVEDGHDFSVPERTDHSGEDIARGDGGSGGSGVGSFVPGGVDIGGNEGVLLDNTGEQGIRVDAGGLGGGGEGVRQGHVGLQGMVDRKGESDAVEAQVADPVGDALHRLLVQALGNIGLHVARPVDAAQLHPLPGRVYDPPARRAERELHCPGPGR